MRDHLATLLDDFRHHGNQIAVVRHLGVRRRVTTYAQIATLAGRFGALLEERGIGSGDRVLLWAENSAEWIAALYGCILRGVLAVPLDAYGSADFASRVAADVRPKLAVGDFSLLGQLPSGIPPLSFEKWDDSLPLTEAGPTPGLSHETPLQILFTSGTTGEPKGVVLTHGNVLASVEPIERGAQHYLRYVRLIHPLRILHTLPLSHVFGQTMGLWVPPILTAEVHFESRLVASRLVETIGRERISVLAAVPRVHGLLKNHLETAYPDLVEEVARFKGEKAWQRWWRFRKIHLSLGLKFWALVSGGGALPGPLEEFWNALGFVVIQGYGMTETTALITLNHPFHVARGSIGKPLPGREVKLGPDGEVLVRGAMISTSTWSEGRLQQRPDSWLATGDLAETRESGDLRFLGRKSEVIVTSSGVNLHPEDLEAVVEQQSGVAACAVVAVETPNGPEACAVVAWCGPVGAAAAAIEKANTQLAEFQRLRRWELWPDPDLPRTSTGKVRRKAVAEWLAERQAASGSTANTASSDWLITLIVQIAGESPAGSSDSLLLSEDLHLDSLGRVQLAAALEERLGMVAESGLLEGIQTLGELRALITEAAPGHSAGKPAEVESVLLAKAGLSTAPDPKNGSDFAQDDRLFSQIKNHEEERKRPHREERFIYPRWPWTAPCRWLRAAFIEVKLRPLVWLLAHPRVLSAELPSSHEPILIVANHVTAFDGPLILYGLPGPLRRKLAIAMAGEMLEDYRHFRNPENGRFMLLGPFVYLSITALFNVFPLPRQREFQRSFAHAGQAMDRGFSVLVFPEGTRSKAGELARFRPGIGLLVKQCATAVLPVALRGLGELKTGQRNWFRSGKIEICVGEPVRFAATETEAAIADRLHREVEKLLGKE
jgi:long-chain acyl-CoA synthetase